MSEQHDTEVVKALTKEKYSAVCGCGWEDYYTYNTEQEAENAASEHILAVS